STESAHTEIERRAYDLLSEPFASSPLALRIDSFLASFCGRVDKSVHWLHYGRQGLGYAIGFNSACIETAGWSSVPVTYDNATTENFFNSYFDVIEKKATEMLAGGADSFEVNIIASQLLATFSTALAPCFKHVAFADEEEWRLFGLHMESLIISDRFMVN